MPRWLHRVGGGIGDVAVRRGRIAWHAAARGRWEIGRGDPLAEAWSRGDGIVGHLVVGATGKTDVSVAEGATQLNVFEAKIYSRLSPGVSNARYYDQAARSVACIAEALHRAARLPVEFRGLGFYVLAPGAQIEKRLFAEQMQKESTWAKVNRRVGEYRGERDACFRDWFEPTLERIRVECLGWASIIDTIAGADAEGGAVIRRFYDNCLYYCASRKERDDEDADG